MGPESPVRRRREALQSFQPGSLLSCRVESLDGSGGLGTTEFEFESVIVRVLSGGFYGYVLDCEEAGVVVKLTQPPERNDFWRLANWKGMFPPQTSRLAALHDHLAADILSQTLPHITQDPQIFAPRSFGITRFDDGLGYAQVLERVDCRPPRFDTDPDEVDLIRSSQHQLERALTRYGVELVGQIHPDNPFAFDNLKIGSQDGRMWMLDTAAAIPHNKFVWPWYWFRYHEQIRQSMGADGPTFNRIHTGRFREALREDASQVPDQVSASLKRDLRLYDQLDHQIRQRGRQSFLNACLESGLIDEKQRQEFLAFSSMKHRLAFELGFDPWFKVVSGWVTERGPVKFLHDQSFRAKSIETLRKLMDDSDFRSKYFLERYALAGMVEANERGIVSDDELAEAREGLRPSGTEDDQKRRGLAYATLGATYFSSSRAFDALEGSAYMSAFFSENPEAAVAVGVLWGWVVPMAFRPLATWMIGKGFGVDLKVATAVSSIPKVGPYFALPAQIAHSQAAKSDFIWHYTLRNLVAKTSSIMRHWGGWGSQHEAELWRRLPDIIKNLSDL